MKHNPDFLMLLNDFNQTLKDCRRVYLDGAHNVVDNYPHLLDRPAKDFINMMDDLHRGLIIKLFVTVAGVDRIWTEMEEHLGCVMFYHVWQRRLGKSELRDSLRHVEKQAAEMNWAGLVRPFAEIDPLRYSIPELETVVIRLGNYVAKADGRPTSLELDELKQAQNRILEFLHKKSDSALDETEDKAKYQIQIDDGRSSSKSADQISISESPPSKRELKEVLADLDELIGLQKVKREVRTLINFVEVQRHRAKLGMPEVDMGLHMVFKGNPGTGKTTVARILGEVYCAMGILEKGHLVETDRAGLVAEYAGQTAPKTERVIDRSIDGVLFIDEAYSLLSSHHEDAFGYEAVQKLLKRMEDDRQRLIVILAGYPDEMDRLLKSNPGLSSRFPHHIDFPDYTPIELAKIFELMAVRNHYHIRGWARAKLQLVLHWLFDKRDRHFGNGRLVRNLFELAIRRLANRVVELPKLTRNLLSRFEAEDIFIEDTPDSMLDVSGLSSYQFHTSCPDCQQSIDVSGELLGRRVKCKKCDHKFRIGWCDFSKGA